MVIYPVPAVENVLSLVNSLHSLFITHTIQGSHTTPRFSLRLHPALYIAQSDSINKYAESSISYLYDDDFNKIFFKNNALKTKASSQEVNQLLRQIISIDHNISHDKSSKQQDVLYLAYHTIQGWTHRILIRDMIEVASRLENNPDNFILIFNYFLTCYNKGALLHESTYLKYFMLAIYKSFLNKEVLSSLIELLLSFGLSAPALGS